jgi:hypothetical protein
VYAAVAWGLGALPGVFTAVAYFIGEKYGDAQGEAATESTLFLTSLDGFVAGAFGMIAALADSSNPAQASQPASLAVLGNTAVALAYGLEKAVVANTYGLSAIAAGVIGGVCTGVAAGIQDFGS